ncbi:RNA-binding protein [Candidatus Gottesmanbacteria bacterium]|nr:RNA-binding protein [Candidatus Gottesmanbacteria bacterium]
MAKKLFVGSLPYTVTDDTLGQLFAQHGQVVSVVVIKDRYTGRSRGFGFVEMSNDEEAQKAMDALNGYSLEGRALVVKEAMPRTNDRPDRGGNKGGRDFGDRRNRY